MSSTTGTAGIFPFGQHSSHVELGSNFVWIKIDKHLVGLTPIRGGKVNFATTKEARLNCLDCARPDVCGTPCGTLKSNQFFCCGGIVHSESLSLFPSIERRYDWMVRSLYFSS